MSIDRSTYTIAGYDISDYRKQIVTHDFKWSDEYENIVNGEVRLFDGSQCRDDDFLFWGVPLFESADGCGEPDPVTLTFEEIQAMKEEVDREWDEYLEVLGFINRDDLTFKIICFEEYS